MTKQPANNKAPRRIDTAANLTAGLFGRSNSRASVPLSEDAKDSLQAA
jgi:hypothetical protein